MHLSSKMTFSAKKAKTHENLSSALQKKLFISLERNIFHVSTEKYFQYFEYFQYSVSRALLLKLHLATISH